MCTRLGGVDWLQSEAETVLRQSLEPHSPLTVAGGKHRTSPLIATSGETDPKVFNGPNVFDPHHLTLKNIL
jgi:hypothetical protein